MLISKLSKSNSPIEKCQLTIVDWRVLISDRSDPHHFNRQSTICNSQSKWWRWTDSNRWPPACKAGALPSELHPRKHWIFSIDYWILKYWTLFNLQYSILNLKWWAWMELNHRPHAYQACALTKLSYRPIRMRKCEFGFRNSNYFPLPNSAFRLRFGLSYP